MQKLIEDDQNIDEIDRNKQHSSCQYEPKDPNPKIKELVGSSGLTN